MNKKNQKTLCSTELKGGTGGYTKTQEKWGKFTMKLKKKAHKSHNKTSDGFFNKIPQ